MEGTDIMIAPIKFPGKVQNLRVSENEHPCSSLDETWVKQNLELENFATKREQAYCVPNGIRKNRLDF